MLKVTNSIMKHGWSPNPSLLTLSALNIHHLGMDCQVLCQNCRLICHDLKSLMQSFYWDFKNILNSARALQILGLLGRSQGIREGGLEREKRAKE